MNLTRAEMDAIAKGINTITGELAGLPSFGVVPVQARAMAFALAAANEVLHTGGKRRDFDNLITAAWEKASKAHR